MGTKFRVTIIGTYYGQTFNNVLNMDNTGTVMNAAQVADDVLAFFVLVVKAWQSNLVTYTGIRVQPMEAGNPASAFKPITIVGAKGNLVVENPFVAGVLKIGTAFGGKKGRGRIYLPGLTIHGIAGGLFTTAGLAIVNDNIVLPLFGSYNGPTGVGNLKLGVMGRAVDSPFHVMTNLQIRSVLGIQRRRQVGVGI